MLDFLAKLSIKILGFDAFCLNKKFLVLNLVDRNLKIKYRRSFLGFFWTILAPLAMSTIYYFVFKVIMNVQRDHYLAFIVCGVLPWNFLVQTIMEGTESIVANSGLLSKIPIPIHVFPYVTSITNFSTLALAVPVIIATAVISSTPITFCSLWTLFFYATLMLFSYAASALLSIAYVYLRDLRHAIGLLLQLWFYATPVLYDSSMIPPKYKFIIYLNPVGAMFEGIHLTFIEGRHPSLAILATCVSWCAISFVLLRVIYLKFKPGLVERI